MGAEGVEGAIEGLKDRFTWTKPQSVGTARVDRVLRPRLGSNMVFVDMGQSEDLSNHPWIFTDEGVFTEGQIVELLVRVKRQTPVTPRQFSYIPHGVPQDCQLAIRPFRPVTYGKVTREDVQTLKPMFQREGNEKNIFTDRALFRRAFRLDKLLKPLIEESLPPGR